MSDSVYALKPKFADREGYIAWRKSWRMVYSHLSAAIRSKKNELKRMQREGDPLAGKAQKNLALMRADARKMMTILDEAKLRRDRIREMHHQLAEQNALFPITINARTVDVHFNKVSNEFSFMPMWTIKAQGKSYYIPHIDAQMGFSTRELEGGSTRGMFRFRNAILTIVEDGTAILSPKVALAA